jgi:hypothetical protein
MATLYSKSAYLLNRNEDMTLLIPSQVNAALALELYFKSLYYLEYGKDFKINGHHSHDFYALFNSLKENIKAYMRSGFQQLIQSREMSDIKKLEEYSKVSIPLDLEGNLKQWSNVFVKVRYMYDNKGAVGSMVFFPEIEKILIAVIQRTKSECQP